MKSDNDDEMLIFHQQQSFFYKKIKKILKSNPFEKVKAPWWSSRRAESIEHTVGVCRWPPWRMEKTALDLPFQIRAPPYSPPGECGGRGNKPFERQTNTLSQILQLIISAHRLHIFGIRRFDNMNYFKVYKRISVRKICIEIDQLPMESATSRTTSFPPPSPHIFARYSSQNWEVHDQQKTGVLLWQ